MEYRGDSSADAIIPDALSPQRTQWASSGKRSKLSHDAGMEPTPMLRKQSVLWCATMAVWSLSAVARPDGQTPQQPRPQGWAVRQSLNASSGTLYNNVKQKLLDGKQVTTFAINKPDVKL